MDGLQKAISCRTKMYTLAKSKKAPKIIILNKILEDAFLDAANGFMLAKLQVVAAEIKNQTDRGRVPSAKMDYFKQECDKLSKAGHQISKFCYDKEHETFREWKERNQDFEGWFRDDYLQCIKDRHAELHGDEDSG